MLDIGRIKEFVMESGLDYVSDVRYRELDNTVLISVLSNKIGDTTGKRPVSLRSIDFLLGKIEKKFNVATDLMIIRGDDHQEVESGLYQLLSNKYGDRLLALYASFPGFNRIDLWIEVAGHELIDLVKTSVTEILSEAGYALGIVSVLSGDKPLPSLTNILMVIKVFAPCDEGFICDSLISKGYAINGERWLKGKLDLLRKKGLIVWQKEKGYVLSVAALSLVPTSTKKDSSDIARALALGRKKW